MSTWGYLIGAEAQIVASELRLTLQSSPVSVGCSRGALVRDTVAVACLNYWACGLYWSQLAQM